MDFTGCTLQYVRSYKNGENIAINVTNPDWDYKLGVPMIESNSDYAEIMRQVEAGTLVIQEADNGAE